VKLFPKTQLIAFGRNVARLRVRAGFTQEELSEKLDIHWRHFQKLEAASVSPSFGISSP
jgi:transcriptional regulator with XRE-family HTH domain